MTRELTPEQAAWRKRSSIDHIWHVWINRRQDERHKQGQPWEHDLYHFKEMLAEVERLPIWLKRARTGTLPTVHQQCSHSAPETIEHNVLRCVLGQDVTECPILQGIYKTFAEFGQDRYYADVTADDADTVAARVCCWHIFTSWQQNHGLDTSEGYVKDEGDRRYWSTVYAHLAAADVEG